MTRSLSAALRTFAIACFADRVVPNREDFWSSTLVASRIGYLIRQSVVSAVDALRTKPQGALAIRTNAIYHDRSRSDQVHAHVREDAAPHNSDRALDRHQPWFLHLELGAGDLDVQKVSKVQGSLDITQLTVHDAQRRALLGNVQPFYPLDRNIYHDEVRHVEVGELFLEVLDERVFDRERVDGHQIRERVVRDLRYTTDIRKPQQFHAARREEDIEVQATADILNYHLLEIARLRKTGIMEVR